MQHAAADIGAWGFPQARGVSQHAVSGQAVSARPVALRAESPGQVLHPGDVVYAGCGERLQTLLGSCVAIILTDPRRTVATMCHVVHAGQPGQRSAQDSAYGEVALAAMARLLRSRGITPGLCEAYVMGGGNMFPRQFNLAHVGLQNARWALAALARDGLRVVLADLGGATYRRVGWTVGPGAPEITAVPV